LLSYGAASRLFSIPIGSMVGKLRAAHPEAVHLSLSGPGLFSAMPESAQLIYRPNWQMRDATPKFFPNKTDRPSFFTSRT